MHIKESEGWIIWTSLGGLVRGEVNIIGSVILPWNRHHRMQLSTTRERMNPASQSEAARPSRCKLHRQQPFLIRLTLRIIMIAGRRPVHLVSAGGKGQTLVSTRDETIPCKHTTSNRFNVDIILKRKMYWLGLNVSFFSPKLFKYLRS